MTDKYLAARAVYEDLDKRSKDAKARADELERALCDLMIDLDIPSFKTVDGVGFTATRKTYYSCPSENREAMMAALKARNMEYLFSVNAQTLQGAMKELAEGEEAGVLPEDLSGIISVYDKQALTVRNKKHWKGGA